MGEQSRASAYDRGPRRNTSRTTAQLFGHARRQADGEGSLWRFDYAGHDIVKSFWVRAVQVSCVVAVSGCLTGLTARPALRSEPSFDPTTFFDGRTRGAGTLVLRLGSSRSISVEGTGHTESDGSFSLHQRITFGDGTGETRAWLLRRIDSTHFVGSLSDARGNVSAETTGNLFHLRYRLRQPAVYMQQWMYLQPDGRSVRNIAQITVLGVVWARLSETIAKVDDGIDAVVTVHKEP